MQTRTTKAEQLSKDC